MTLLIISFIAGVLTVLAPCILPLLPVIVGGSVGDQRRSSRPYIIAASLAVSIIVFTLLLKFSTSLLGIPAYVWQIVSGVIITVLGVSMVLPKIWEGLGAKLNILTGRWLGSAGKHSGPVGDIITGAALGPVFNSCSPTYAFIVAGTLPVSFGEGFIYLAAYTIGLTSVLLVVTLLGQKIITRLGWASNPNGWFKRIIGILFIIVGLTITSGIDRTIQTYLVQRGWYDAPAQFENSLLNH